MKATLRAWAVPVLLAVVMTSLAGCGSAEPPPISKPGSPLPPDMAEVQKGMLEAAQKGNPRSIGPRGGR